MHSDSNAPFGGADFQQVLDAVKAAVADVIELPKLFDATRARRYVGLSKTGWHRAKSAGLLPRAVYVEGSGERWRRVDLDRYVAALKPRRKK